jgi:pyruvate dehydrogenase E2 component (dihydrolipoamide acetyltransferase)
LTDCATSPSQPDRRSDSVRTRSRTRVRRCDDRASSSGWRMWARTAQAEIKRWLVRAGDRVTLDQPLVEIETDKAVVELPAPVAGTISRLGAAEGDPSRWGTGGADRASARGSRCGHADGRALRRRRPWHGEARPCADNPAVRKLARDRGVDLDAVPGSGAGGQVLAADVEAIARAGTRGGARWGVIPSAKRDRSRPSTIRRGRAPPIAPTPAARDRPSPGDERQPLRGLRRRIARTMTQA